MSGWAPFPVDEWPATVELLQRSGDRWTPGAAIFDLRWHVDQRLPLPGRPALAQRWRWKDWEVRELLADTPAWWDVATQGPAPTSRAELEERVKVVKRSSSRTPPGHLQDVSRSTTDEAAQSGESLQDGARTPPGRRHTRDGDPPSPSPSEPIPQPPASTAGGLTEFDEDQVTALTPVVHAVQARSGAELAQIARGDVESRHVVGAVHALAELRKRKTYVGSTRKRTVKASLVEAARRVVADEELLAELQREAAHGRDPPDVEVPPVSSTDPPPPSGAPP